MHASDEKIHQEVFNGKEIVMLAYNVSTAYHFFLKMVYLATIMVFFVLDFVNGATLGRVRLINMNSKLY